MWSAVGPREAQRTPRLVPPSVLLHLSDQPWLQRLRYEIHAVLPRRPRGGASEAFQNRRQWIGDRLAQAAARGERPIAVMAVPFDDGCERVIAGVELRSFAKGTVDRSHAPGDVG